MIVEPPCFLRGTRIATPAGEKPIEDLKIGDRVTTADGGVADLKWIGVRRFRGQFFRWPEGLRPIRIKRGALGRGVPRRDLFVSPNHALLIDGVLVEAHLLTNDVSIVRVKPATGAWLDYFNPEIAAHGAILAEGVSAETYLDCGNRESFGNFAEYYARYGKTAPAAASFAPRIVRPWRIDWPPAAQSRGIAYTADPGPILAAIRARIDAYAEALPAG